MVLYVYGVFFFALRGEKRTHKGMMNPTHIRENKQEDDSFEVHGLNP
jgi:hypothetical protein